METLLQQQKEKKYTSNQEEGFNSMLLRLESPPIPTPSPTDQESPIMFSDSCSMCGSKKRRCLTPSFGQRKKTILIDPSSMNTAAAAASSADDERSHSRHSSSFFHQIPPNSSPPPQTSPPPCFRRSVSDMSSFALSGSFSSPKSASAVAAIPSNQTSSCPSNAAYLGRSNSFSSGFDSLKSTISPPPPTTTTTTLPEMISPFSSPKSSPENAAASTPNRKSNPSNNASYFGRSSSFSSCFDSPSSSSSPSFHLPKSSTTATPTPTDSVQKSDDDQKDQSKDCSSGNCKFGVSAATTTTTTDHHPKHEQIEEGNIKKVQFSCSCGKHYQVQFFG